MKSLFELFFGEGSWRGIFGPSKQEKKVMDKWQEDAQKGSHVPEPNISNTDSY